MWKNPFSAVYQNRIEIIGIEKKCQWLNQNKIDDNDSPINPIKYFLETYNFHVFIFHILMNIEINPLGWKGIEQTAQGWENG